MQPFVVPHLLGHYLSLNHNGAKLNGGCLSCSSQVIANPSISPIAY
jgi:hypothetical protein